MADDKKGGSSTATERNRLARKARCAKALAKGKKAGKPEGPRPPNWDAQRAAAKKRSRHEKALEAMKLPRCLQKYPGYVPDMPTQTAAAQLRATIQDVKAKKAEEASPAS